MDSWFPTFRRLANKRIPFPIPTLWPWRTGAARRRSLLRLIAAGIEEKLPLGPLVEVWAADERGPQKYRVERLARLLNDGTPLPDAVEQVPGVLRDEDVLAIRFDAQSGTQTAAVRELLDESAMSSNRPPRVRNSILYLGTILLIGFVLVSFLQFKIVPEFNKILEEFDQDPPSAFEWSIRLSNVFARYWWVGALAALALVWSAFSAGPGRFIRYAILGRFFEPLRELRAADVLQKLGIATGAGRPVPGALSTLARYHFDPTTRHKLLFVRNEVEQGADVWQSMNAVELLTQPEVRLLTTAERVGNRPWALKQLAWGKRQRTERGLERLSQLLLPVLVLVLGAFVLFQALTIFLPLTQMLNSLA